MRRRMRGREVHWRKLMTSLRSEASDNRVMLNPLVAATGWLRSAVRVYVQLMLWAQNLVPEGRSPRDWSNRQTKQRRGVRFCREDSLCAGATHARPNGNQRQ